MCVCVCVCVCVCAFLCVLVCVCVSFRAGTGLPQLAAYVIVARSRRWALGKRGPGRTRQKTAEPTDPQLPKVLTSGIHPKSYQGFLYHLR